MTYVDYALIAIVAISMVFGVIRGFLRESIGLMAWLGGLWFAWREAPRLAPHLGGALTDTELQIWVARGLILVAIVVCGWLIASLLSYLVHRSGISLSVDRLFGGVFGLVRGAVIASLLVMLGQAAELEVEGWWQASRVMPWAEELAGVLRNYAESGLDAVERDSFQT
jgi:membrane protein required for colicin V production